MRPYFRFFSLLISLSLVLYPILILVCVGLFLIPETIAYLKEIMDVCLTATILMVAILLIPNVKIRKVFILLTTFLLAILVFVKLSFYYHYGVKINASAFFVIFETYALEASDFLTNYFDVFVWLLLVLLFLPIYVIFNFINKKKPEVFEYRLRGIVLKAFGLLLVFFSGYVLVWKFQRENLALIAVESYKDYKMLKRSLKDNLAKPISKSIEVTSFSEEPQTNIVIIGESTSSRHMQLYGYKRETNPLLTKIKDELLIFEDVITPNVHTLLALEKILTLSDYEHPQKNKNGSVVQLANQAGFDTYWLSNQRPMGFNESVATLIGNASKQSYFINSKDFMDTIYDESMFPSLDSILLKGGEKKLIFIHLIGTHIDYDKRYPKHFDHFKDDDIVSEFATKATTPVINAYDNAVLYNDFIISTIIEKARKIESVGYVVYFSDHGDEVYDTMDLMGHNEYHATKPMYEVPFIVWLSDGYKKKHPNSGNLKTFTNRPYNLEDFIHSFSDLTDIKFKGFDERKSIFNSHFEERTRWIKEKIDYDHQ